MDKKVKVLEKVPEIKLVGRKIGPYAEGEEVSLEPWEASILEDRGLVESVNDYSITGLRKLLMKEEKNKKLNDIPPHLYLTVSLKIRKLKQEGKAEESENMREAFNSLISLRLQKLLRMVVSSVTPDDIPPEEAFLLNRLSEDLELWKQRLDPIFKKSTHEEVGNRDRELRRSFQGVVGNTTDIQG